MVMEQLCIHRQKTNFDLNLTPYTKINSEYIIDPACICMAESLCCPPETITTLLTILQHKIKSSKIKIKVKLKC